jgi:hypothetical protein
VTNKRHSDGDQPDDQRIERYSFGQSTSMAGQDHQEWSSQHSQQANNPRQN